MDVLTGVGVWIVENIKVLLEIVGAFALIATLTPNKADDEIMGWVLKAVNFMGANTGKAANKDE